MAAGTRRDTPGRHLILYDGLCGLCSRSNQFVLRRDTADAFRFAALQSGFARATLERLGEDPHQALTTLYVVSDYATSEARLLRRSDAVLFVLDHLGGIWRGARLAHILPRRARDRFYHFVSSNRYRWFGRFDACPVPTPATRGKFIATE